MAAVQTDGPAARLAHGEPDLVEHGLVHPGPARHGRRHKTGGPDVFGLGAEAEFNGGHAIPLERTCVHARDGPHGPGPLTLSARPRLLPTARPGPGRAAADK